MLSLGCVEFRIYRLFFGLHEYTVNVAASTVFINKPEYQLLCIAFVDSDNFFLAMLIVPTILDIIASNCMPMSIK